jgi:hypothetical protein
MRTLSPSGVASSGLAHAARHGQQQIAFGVLCRDGFDAIGDVKQRPEVFGQDQGFQAGAGVGALDVKRRNDPVFDYRLEGQFEVRIAAGLSQRRGTE